jgi:type VI secretion system protein ImpL
VLITGLWSTSYLLNQSKLNEVTKQLKAYDETFTKAPPPISEWGINFSRVLARLEKMQEIQQIYPTDASIMMGFGLYQGEDLQKDLQKTYEQILQNQLLPLIKDRLEKRIKDQLNTSDTDTLAMLLKAYKDLGDEGAKQKMTDDIRLIKGDWVKLYQPQHDTDTPKKLAKHLNNLYQIPFQSFQLNTSLIDEAKLKIGVDPASEIYRHIQEESSERTDYVPFNLATKLGSSAAQAFAMDNETVPFLFTYDGFAVFLKKLAEKIIQFEEKDKLVHTGVDSQQLAATVRQHYYQDYIAHWEKLLNKIKVKPTSTFAQLNEVLMAVQGPNSVMRKLLEIVKKETALTQSIPDPLAIAKKTQLGLAVDKVLASEAKTTQSDEVLGKKVVDHFQPLIELVTVPAGGVAKFDETNAALKTLASCMVTIKGNIDKGTPQDNPECLAAIEQLKMQSALPAPIGNMLKTLADKSESTISGVNTSKLNEAWKSEVFSVYQTLKTRYPFNKHSSEEVALADFTKMFAPVGALNSFFNTRFKNSAEWNTNERAKAQIQRSLNFGNMFFALGSPTPLIKFTLKLVSLSPEASGFTLSINGDSHTFLVGDDLRQAFQWPGTGDVVFHFQTGTEKKMDKEISGIWALFKALEEAHITRQSQKTYRLTFVQDDLQAEYELRADYDDNPFSLKEFAQFNLPSSL